MKQAIFNTAVHPQNEKCLGHLIHQVDERKMMGNNIFLDNGTIIVVMKKWIVSTDVDFCGCIMKIFA